MPHVGAQAVERAFGPRHVPDLDLLVHRRGQQQMAEFGEQADGVDALGVSGEGARTLLGDVAAVA